MLRYSIGCVLGAVIFCLSMTANAETKVVAPKDATEPRVGFVKIKVGDLDQGVDFYHRVLPMQDIGRIGDKSAAVQEATLKFGPGIDQAKASDHTGIILVFRPAVKPAYSTADEIPVAVLTVPDVGATIKRAGDAGFPIVRQPHDAGNVVIGEIKDPSGNVLELIHLK